MELHLKSPRLSKKVVMLIVNCTSHPGHNNTHLLPCILRVVEITAKSCDSQWRNSVRSWDPASWAMMQALPEEVTDYTVSVTLYTVNGRYSTNVKGKGFSLRATSAKIPSHPGWGTGFTLLFCRGSDYIFSHFLPIIKVYLNLKIKL